MREVAAALAVIQNAARARAMATAAAKVSQGMRSNRGWVTTMPVGSFSRLSTNAEL